jgi:hypothetical protein
MNFTTNITILASHPLLRDCHYFSLAAVHCFDPLSHVVFDFSLTGLDAPSRSVSVGLAFPFSFRALVISGASLVPSTRR